MRTGLRCKRPGPVVKGPGPGCEFGNARCAFTGACERACVHDSGCVCVCVYPPVCVCERSAPVRGKRKQGSVHFVFIGEVKKWNGLVQCLRLKVGEGNGWFQTLLQRWRWRSLLPELTPVLPPALVPACQGVGLP